VLPTTAPTSPLVASDEVYTQAPASSAGTPEPTQSLEEMTPAKNFTIVSRRCRHWMMIPASGFMEAGVPTYRTSCRPEEEEFGMANSKKPKPTGGAPETRKTAANTGATTLSVKNIAGAASGSGQHRAVYNSKLGLKAIPYVFWDDPTKELAVERRWYPFEDKIGGHPERPRRVLDRFSAEVEQEIKTYVDHAIKKSEEAIRMLRCERMRCQADMLVINLKYIERIAKQDEGLEKYDLERRSSRLCYDRTFPDRHYTKRCKDL
ncbi:hypothetical protein BGZ54_004442, partial [Gamsiella multidivaricata]